MKKLSLLDKNAYLSVYLSTTTISATLSYSHYEIDRKYNLVDTTIIDFDRDRVDTVVFWEHYLLGLEQRFDWALLKEDYSTFRQVIDFEDEGVGVAGIRITLWNSTPHINDVVSSIRSVSPLIEIRPLDQDKFGSRLAEVAEKLNYKDLIWLELNPTSFKINRTTKRDIKKSFQNIKLSEWEHANNKISWDNKDSLIEIIRSEKLQAFLAQESVGSNLINLWANYLYRPVISTSNKALIDLFRAYTTGQLYSIYNDNKKRYEKFGTSNKKSLLIVSGTLARNLGRNKLLVALLDGLQIRGSFDLITDFDSNIIKFGDIYTLGINASNYIVTGELLTDIPSRVYVPEIPGHANEQKLIFTGDLKTGDGVTTDIYALTKEITTFKIPSKITSFVKGQFVKGAYVEGMEGSDTKLEIASDTLTGNLIKEVIIDGRYKPVIYGPDIKANREKMKSWNL